MQINVVNVCSQIDFRQTLVPLMHDRRVLQVTLSTRIARASISETLWQIMAIYKPPSCTFNCRLYLTY